MNAIEIVLTGVIYLLGTSSEANPGTVRVIIPNVAHASSPFGHVIPDHYPYIKVLRSQVEDFDAVTSLRRPDFLYNETISSSGQFAVFGLRGDEITISGNKPDPLVLCKKVDCGFRINGEQKTTYEVIPHKEKICSKCGNLDDVFLKSTARSLVVARMTIQHGTLSGAHADTEKWTFQPASRKDDTMIFNEFQIGDQAVLDLDARDADFVTLTLKPLAGGGNPLILKLKDKAVVEIGNLMFDDILPLVSHHGAQAVDPHFALYYTMLDRPIEPIDPPIPHRTKLPPAHVGGVRQNCQPLAQETGF